MPGPQTQHKGTVYGDDENAPKPGLGPPVRHTDRSTPTGGPRAALLDRWCARSRHAAFLHALVCVHAGEWQGASCDTPDGVRMLKRLKQHREAVDAPRARSSRRMSASKGRVDADKTQPPLQVPLRDSESQAGEAEGTSSPHDGSGPHGGRQVAGMRGTLSWHHLVGVTFFAVCGGDYGLEDSVGAAGPALTLLGLLILPWVWSLPIALMTAELGSMIPEAGGYVVWINRAFGPFAAHMNAVLNLVSNTFDNALYPVMFVDYLHYFPAMRLEGWARWLVSVAMLSVVTVLNLLGVDVVLT